MKKLQSFVLEEKPEVVELYVESLCKTLQKLKLYGDYHSISKNLPFVVAVNLKFP